MAVNEPLFVVAHLTKRVSQHGLGLVVVVIDTARRVVQRGLCGSLRPCKRVRGGGCGAELRARSALLTPGPRRHAADVDASK